MIKLLLVVAAASVAVGVPAQESEKIYSLHTRYAQESLNLTAGELKLFSGHAMNMIKGKCPAVDQGKIFNVQKYIGKLLAKRDPKRGSNDKVQLLLKTITECAKEGVVAQPQPASVFGRYFPSIFPFPFRPQMRKVVIEKVPEEWQRSTEPPTATTYEIEPVDLTSEDDDEHEPTPRVLTTTIFIRPEDMQEGIIRNGGFFNWIHRLFSQVNNFFHRINPFQSRAKRDIPDSPMHPVPSALAKEPYGKVALGSLIDEMCRIYCDKCTGKREMILFKKAAKQLLDDLFEDDSGLDAAAHQFLDEGFLKSIKNC